MHFPPKGASWLPMTISEERLEEFIRIWEEIYGEPPPPGEERAIATRLVKLYGHMARFAAKNPSAQTAPEEPSSDRA